MNFSDQFKKEDKQQALLYRKEIFNNQEASSELINQGKLDKAEMHLAHAMRILGDLRIMKIQNETNKKMLTDHAVQSRRNWF